MYAYTVELFFQGPKRRTSRIKSKASDVCIITCCGRRQAINRIIAKCGIVWVRSCLDLRGTYVAGRASRLHLLHPCLYPLIYIAVTLGQWASRSPSHTRMVLRYAFLLSVAWCCSSDETAFRQFALKRSHEFLPCKKVDLSCLA